MKHIVKTDILRLALYDLLVVFFMSFRLTSDTNKASCGTRNF